MQTYPYDWKGTNPQNAFTEHRIIDSDLPEERVVILDHRPFFGGDKLVITPAGSSTPLTLGVDYQLAYMMPELDDSLASSVYCGVQILNPQIGGELIFKGQVLGESFYSPFVDILDYLVKYLNNPVDVDWLKLNGRPTLYAPQPAATSWADLVNKKYLASAVRDVELDADAANTAIAQKLAELKTTVAGLHSEIVAFNYPAHIASHMAHNITVAQSGAHPVNLKTPDTFLAYGKNLRTLMAEIRALGLQQSDINNYIEKWVSKDVDGVFIQQLAANRSLFKSKGGVSEITFTDTAFILKSNGSVVLSAGYLESDTTMRFMEWKSGTNTLRIESSGNALGMDKLTLNGKVLLTTNTLLEYQSQGNGGGTTDPDDTKVYVNGAGGLAFTGKGSKADPIKGTLTLPTASTTTKGVARLKSTAGTESTGYAATPNALAPYEGKASGYVPKTTMLNSKPMDDTTDRKVTKAEIGLDAVDNTSDLAKPISNEQQVELDALSAKDHKHDWSELPLPTATSQAKGIATYTTTEGGLASQRGVAPNVLKMLSDRLDIVAAALVNVKTGTVVDFAALNSSNWNASSSTRVEVQDLEYFWQMEGERDDGEVSGGIDLQTTPMFQWFKPGNRLEDTWPAAVLSNGTGLTFTGISKTPQFPLKPEPISVTATEMGAIGVKSLLAKRRIRIRSGKINLFIAAGGPITVYLDGTSVASGNSPLAVELTVDSSDITHCIGIRTDCTDTAKSAAMMYEIYDGTVPVARSRVGDPVQWLQEFVTEWKGIRHYLYMSMLSGSLYSRAEPVESQGMDLDHQLIGYIDVPAGGLVSNTKYPFPKMFDFGPSKEIAAHIVDTTTAHKPGKNDWRLSDNGKMALMGKMTLNPDCSIRGTTVTATNANGMLYATQNAAVTNEVMLSFSASQGQTPAQWFTPRNPKADGHPTYEGGLLIDMRQRSVPASIAGIDLVLIGALSGASAAYQRHSFLRVKFDGSKPKFGFASAIVPGNTGNAALPTFNLADAPCTVTMLQSVTSPNSSLAIALDMVTLKNQYPRAAVRYRYDCETRVLRIWQAFTPGGTETITISEYEIKFDFDLAHYFGGYVGLMFAPSSVVNTFALLPSLYPPRVSQFNENNYHYYRSLFESYMDGRLPAGSLASSTFQEVTGPFFPNPLLTEVLTLPADGGLIGQAITGILPTAFQRGRMLPGSLMLGAGPGWRSNMSDPAGGRYLNPATVGYQIPANISVSKIVFSYKATMGGSVWMNDDAATLQTFNANTTASNVVLTMTPSADFKNGDRTVVVQFVPPVPGKLGELRAEYTFEVYDESNNVALTVGHGSIGTMYGAGRRYVIEKSAPYHMTSYIWDYMLSRMRIERDGEGTDFGQWA